MINGGKGRFGRRELDWKGLVWLGIQIEKRDEFIVFLK